MPMQFYRPSRIPIVTAVYLFTKCGLLFHRDADCPSELALVAHHVTVQHEAGVTANKTHVILLAYALLQVFLVHVRLQLSAVTYAVISLCAAV